MKRVLITGPTRGLERYTLAARSAGWEAIEAPLLCIETIPGALESAGRQPFDWIAVTSSNAVAALAEQQEALGSIPCAAVGSRTAQCLRQHGFDVVLESDGTAEDLAAALLLQTPRAANILWPRGNLAQDLVRILEKDGRSVVAVEVYTTRIVDDLDLPACEATFLASPSAVQALPQAPAIALTIGRTTAAAARERFGASPLIVLDQATPDALERALKQLA